MASVASAPRLRSEKLRVIKASERAHTRMMGRVKSHINAIHVRARNNRNRRNRVCVSVGVSVGVGHGCSLPVSAAAGCECVYKGFDRDWRSSSSARFGVSVTHV